MPEAGRASVKFVGDYSSLMAGLTSTLAPGKLKSVGLKAGLAVGGAFAASKVVDQIAAAVDVTKKFDKQISSLGSVADASSRQMEKLRKQAISMGADTVYSATEAAQAQVELAKGGLSASQILGGALKSSLNLAAAGELDLADAAETVVNSMQLFGLSGRATAKVADMLATAANRTTADVLDFSMALKQGGSVAKTAGYSMNDTVVILEALAEAGIKNSDAGTSMKASLIQLLNPTKKQAALSEQLGLSWVKQNGELKNGIEISRSLHRATEEMTKAERVKTFAILAGTDGFRTLSALYDAGVPKLQKYARANREQGTAAEVAAKKTDNLSGDVEQLAGAWETFQINVGTALTPALREATQAATGLVDKLNSIDLSDEIGDTGTSWAEGLSKSFEVMKGAAQITVDPKGGIERIADALKGDKEEVSQLQATIKARLEAAGALKRTSIIARDARRRAAAATRGEKAAEADLRNARKRFGDGSDEVLRAEIRLQRAKRRTIRLTKEAKQAERLQGVERKVVASRTRDQVVQEKSRIVVLNRQVRALGRQWEAERRNNGNSKVARELESKIIAKIKQREGTQKRLNNVLADASRQIGPKFAKSLANISGKAATMEKALGRLPSPTRNVRQALGQLPPTLQRLGDASKNQLGRAGDSMKDLQDSASGLRRVYNRNMGMMPPKTSSAMGSIQDALKKNLDAIQNLGTPQAKRHGGLVEWVRQRFQGGGVPVALSPGEMYKTPDGKAGVVPGRPTASDNVLTSMPVGTKIFTFDGQRRLMEGASESQALRDQLPHFASGGIVKPEIVGGTKRSAEVANAAIGKAHSAAKAKLKKERMQNRFGTGGGANFQGKLVADWIVPILKWAQAHGWSGAITSGYRDPGQVVSNAQGIVAPQGQSNHNSLKYPGGAIDVGDPGARAAGQALASVLAGYPGNPKLVWGGPVINDWGHFSATGHRRGGIIEALRQHFRSGGYAAGIWAGSQIDKMYPKSDGYSGAKLPPYLIKALAEYFGLPGVTMEQITQGESMGRPGVDISDPPGRSRGLYAINDHYNGQYGTDKLRNPIYNTWVAKQLADAAGGPNSNIWHGSGHVTGWDLHYDADGEKIRRIAKRFGGGGGEGQGMSAAEKAKAASKSRRESREKWVEDMLRKAGGTKSALGKKGVLWQIVDMYAKFGDFDTAKMAYDPKTGGVGVRGVNEAAVMLSKAKGIAGLPNPNRGAGQLYGLVKWLQDRVELTGAEDGNDRLSKKLANVRDAGKDQGKKKRQGIYKKLARFGTNFPWGKGLDLNANRIELLEELISNTDREQTAEWSEGGSEYTANEIAQQVGLYQKKLTSENKRYRMLTYGIDWAEKTIADYREKIKRATPKSSPLHWKLPGFRKGLKAATDVLNGGGSYSEGLRDQLKGLVGLTGDGGTRGDTYFRLRELGVMKPGGGSGSGSVFSIQDLLSVVEAARFGVYDQLPQFHTGGVYRAPSGQSEGPALLRDGETIRTPEQERALGGDVKVEVNFANGMEWLREFVDVRVVEGNRSANQMMKAGVR